MQEAEKQLGNHPGLRPKETATHSCQAFLEPQDGQDYSNSIFKDCAGHSICFTNCRFFSCVFERCYFRSARFVNCTFVGARFIDCNFREATFVRCDLKYSQFRGTLAEIQQLLVNLPDWPNVRRDLIRSLRLNFHGLGDTPAVRRLIREELEAEREHLRQARERRSGYYADHYGSIQARIRVYWQSFLLWLDRVIWGHGEYPGKLLIALVVFLTGMTTWHWLSFSSSGQLSTSLGDFSIAGRDVLRTFLALPASGVEARLSIALTLVAVGRFIFFGLVVGTITRLLARR